MTQETTGVMYMTMEGNSFGVEIRTRQYLNKPRVRVRIWGKTVPIMNQVKIDYPEHIYLTVDQFAAQLLRQAGHDVPAHLIFKENISD